MIDNNSTYSFISAFSTYPISIRFWTAKKIKESTSGCEQWMSSTLMNFFWFNIDFLANAKIEENFAKWCQNVEFLWYIHKMLLSNDENILNFLWLWLAKNEFYLQHWGLRCFKTLNKTLKTLKKRTENRWIKAGRTCTIWLFQKLKFLTFNNRFFY